MKKIFLDLILIISFTGNSFAETLTQALNKAYNNNATKEELINLLSKGRAKKGIFEGNLVDGELEIGQISSSINQIKSVDQIFMDLINDFNNQVNDLSDIRF